METREALTVQIEEKEEEARKSMGIVPPMSSSKAKGSDYIEVQNAFKNAGFSDIQIFDEGKHGLFSSKNDVKDITIGGDDSFSTKDLFLPTEKVIIYYYSE